MTEGSAAPPLETIVLVPIGGFPARRAEEVAARVSRRVAAACRVERSPATAVSTEGARIEGREQLDADVLLARLEALPAAPGAARVGLTDADCGIPLFTHVFGRARLSGSAAVVSLARLAPAFYGLPDDPSLTLRRAVREILHELGHVSGLAHCREAECLMRFAGTVDAADARGDRFCRECAALLPEGLRPARYSE